MRYYKDDSLLLDILLHLLLYGNHFSIQPSIFQIQSNILALALVDIHQSYILNNHLAKSALQLVITMIDHVKNQSRFQFII